MSSEPQPTAELLQRILEAIEPPKRNRGVEVARAFDSRPLRMVLAILAVLPFLGTLAALGTMPICHD